VPRVVLSPVAAHDPFGRGYKHRAGRLLLDSDGVLRKLCWLVLELDGSVSLGFSDPSIVLSELGRTYADPSGRLTDDEGTVIAGLPLGARTNPHVTLHRSGECQIRTRGRDPLVQTHYGSWCPPRAELLWLYLHSDPAGGLPVARRAGPRDAIATFPNAGSSAAIRADIIPRAGDTFSLVATALHTVIGIAPEYAVRLTLFEHAPVPRRLLIAVHEQDQEAG
jgi:hypothetical protein